MTSRSDNNHSESTTKASVQLIEINDSSSDSNDDDVEVVCNSESTNPIVVESDDNIDIIDIDDCFEIDTTGDLKTSGCNSSETEEEVTVVKSDLKNASPGAKADKSQNGIVRRKQANIVGKTFPDAPLNKTEVPIHSAAMKTANISSTDDEDEDEHRNYGGNDKNKDGDNNNDSCNEGKRRDKNRKYNIEHNKNNKNLSSTIKKNSNENAPGKKNSTQKSNYLTKKNANPWIMSKNAKRKNMSVMNVNKRKPGSSGINNGSRDNSKSNHVLELIESLYVKEQKSGPRPIVIDGCNVAFAHGSDDYVTSEKLFSVQGIKLCIEYFRNLGHTKIMVILPFHYQNKCEDDHDYNILNQLSNDGYVSYVQPVRSGPKFFAQYDDWYTINYALNIDGIIVSRDNYKDLLNADSYAGFNDVIKNRVLSFLWFGNYLMLPRFPNGFRKPCLKEFLNF